MLTMVLVRDYLSTHHRASLDDIAVHFDSSPDAVRQVLDRWLVKGKVRRLDSGTCCKPGGGCSCAAKPAELYEWVA